MPLMFSKSQGGRAPGPMVAPSLPATFIYMVDPRVHVNIVYGTQNIGIEFSIPHLQFCLFLVIGERQPNPSGTTVALGHAKNDVFGFC